MLRFVGTVITGVLVGLLVGSVSTVLGEEPSLAAWGRRQHSRCPLCSRRLLARDLIPIVSFLFARGRCRQCGAPIPRWHLWAELGGGLLLGVAGFLVTDRPTADALLALIALALLFVLTVIDLRLFLLPDQLTGTLAVVGIVRSLALGAPGLGGSIAGGAVGFLALGALSVLPWPARHRLTPGVNGSDPWGRRSSPMGLGDVKLAAALGVLLGVGALVTALFLAFVVGGVIGLVLIGLKKATPKTRIPFGPFLALGAAVVLLFPALPLAFFHLLGLA